MARKNSKSAYAKAGVNPAQIGKFKDLMKAVGKRTLKFSLGRNVRVQSGAHGGIFQYLGKKQPRWGEVLEGLGNKNWIAEWMHMHAGPRTYYEGIGIDTALMAVNDLIAQGAMPFMYEDEVAAGDSEWFSSESAKVLAESFYRACLLTGMALPAGESPSLRYLVNAKAPVTSAPVLSGCATGIITHDWQPQKVRAGDCIIAVASSGLHANGISLVISEAMKLKAQFLTPLPGGNTLGEEALIPTCSYVGLVEALLTAGVPVRKFLPGTGGGVGKIAVDKRALTYRIHDWLPVPPIFQCMHQGCGVPLKDCLETFNWGVGYYVFVPKPHVARTLFHASDAGHEAHFVGRVEEGRRKVIFEPPGTKRMILFPPEE